MGYEEMYWSNFEKSGSLEAYIGYKTCREEMEVSGGDMESKGYSAEGDTGWRV